VETAFIQGVNGRLHDDGLALHRFTSLAEGQTKNESWRRDKKQHRPYSALGHLTPIVFVAQLQASRIAEKVARSSSELSRDGTNVRMPLQLSSEAIEPQEN
jgi:hypothetical protein